MRIFRKKKKILYFISKKFLVSYIFKNL